MSHQTFFIEPFKKHLIINELKKGSKDAENLIHEEFDRLENRIKNLELGLSVAIEKYQRSTIPDLDKIDNTIRGKSFYP